MDDIEFYQQQYRSHLANFAGPKGGYQRRIARLQAGHAVQERRLERQAELLAAKDAGLALYQKTLIQNDREQQEYLDENLRLNTLVERHREAFTSHAQVMRAASVTLNDLTDTVNAQAAALAKQEAINRGLFRTLTTLLDTARVVGRPFVFADDAPAPQTIEGELAHG